MNSPTFIGWPKISRLNRGICITEKIDGSNSAIGVTENGQVYAQGRQRILTPDNDNFGFARWVEIHAAALREHLGVGLHFGEWWGVGINRGYDLSERRFSLFNVARWEKDEAGKMALSLLRTMHGVAVHAVPILYEGPWTATLGYVDGPMTEVAQAVGEGPVWLEAPQEWPAFDEGGPNPRPRFAPNFIREWLARVGSQAAPGYMKPEGIVVYHKAGDVLFKATIERDEEYKGATAQS